MRLVLDTSVFIAREVGRPVTGIPADADLAISVVTLAELRAGVLAAGDDTRAARLATYDTATAFDALVINRAVAERYAELAAAVSAAGRKPRVQDTWIAATASVHGAAVATQDNDFDQFVGVAVVKV